MLNSTNYVNTALQKLDDYIDFVLHDNGQTVNQYERLAVVRFIKFKSKYTYKEKEVTKVLRFFSLINITVDNKLVQYPVAPHEVFWTANIIGLYKDESTRLFDQTYISIAKGNNKSTYAGILSLYNAIGTGIINSHVICVASTKDQARQLIEIIERILKSSPALTDYFKINRNIIINKTSTAINKIEIKSSDVGGIHGVGSNLNLVVCDEYAQFKTSELQTVLKSAQEAKTKNHHQLIITHATSDKFKSPAYELQEICQNILKGSVVLDNIFTQIFTLDSVDEVSKPECWRKSNPMLNIAVPLSNLLTSYENGLIFQDKLNTFKTFNLNLWLDNQNNGENWIPDEVIKENMSDFVFNPDIPVVLGCDLSHQRDLSCVGWVQFDPATDCFYSDVQFIFPNNERKKIKEHGSIDISRWFITDDKPDNYILKCETPVLDHDLVLNFFENLSKSLEIQAVGFDPYLAGQIEYKLQSELGLDVVNVQMNWKLTKAIQFVERLLLTNKLIMKPNPVLRWNFQNVLISQSENGNLFLKKKEKESIDGVVSIVIAMAVWLDQNQTKYQFMIDSFDKLYTKEKKTA